MATFGPSLGGRERGRTAMDTCILLCRKNVQEKTPQGRSEVCHVYKRRCKQRKLLLFSSILAKKRGPWWHYYCSLGPEARVFAPEAWRSTEVPLCSPQPPPGTSTYKRNNRLRERRWPQGLYLEAQNHRAASQAYRGSLPRAPPALPRPPPYLACLRHLHPSSPSVTSTLRIGFLISLEGAWSSRRYP